MIQAFMVLPDRNVSELEDFRLKDFRTGKTHGPLLEGTFHRNAQLDAPT